MERVLRILCWPLLALDEAGDRFGHSRSCVWFFIWGAMGLTVVPSLSLAVLMKDPQANLFALAFVAVTMHIVGGIIFEVLTLLFYGRPILRK